MIRIRLTLREFIRALDRAQADDRARPWLCSYRWLLDHAHVSDDEVMIDTGVKIAPGTALDH